MRSAKALEWVQNLKNGVGTFTHGKLENGLETLYLSINMKHGAIHLTDIYLPESEQRQGFGTAIVAALEDKASELKLELIIGPLMGEEDEDGNTHNYLEAILSKRSYMSFPPFCARWNKAKAGQNLQ